MAMPMAMPTLSAAGWIKVSTANFDLYTSTSESDARQTLETFERTRDFFLRVKPATQVSQLPITLVAFANAKEYKQYSAKSFTPAYFTSDEQRDYIVMSDLGELRERAAVHEYVHVLVRHSGLNVPLWLNEGMADVYSTMKVQDGRVVVGATPKDRTYSLVNTKWLRLPALLAVDARSPAYNEATRAGVFYAQSWLLAHMLMLGEGYAEKFPAFVERLSASGSAQTAFSEIYGKPVAEIEMGMNTYLRQTSIGAAGFRATLRTAEIGPARAATDLEMGVILAKLTGFAGRPAEAMSRLEQLAATHPANVEIDEAKAYAAFRGGDVAAALGYFQTALARGASSWKTHWDYARLLLLDGGDRKVRMQSLRKALDAKPDLADARLMLGVDLYTAEEFAEALTELQRIKDIGADREGSLYLTMALSAARLNRQSEAAGYAAEASKRNLSPAERASLQRIKDILQEKSTPAESEADEVTARPILRRTSPPKPTRK
jgi:tetratricopeptide (TPR) repeat protein